MPPRRPNPPTAAPPPEGPLTVESLGGEGDGVVRAPGGRVLHVAGVLPGEVIRLGPGPDGPVLLSVEASSPDRRSPPCSHFGRCGGCALQHWEDAAALAWKIDRLRATLALEGLETDILTVART